MQGLFFCSSPACVDLGLTAPLSPRERREQMKPFILAKNLFFGSIPISLQRGGRRRARCARHARRQRVGTEGMPRSEEHTSELQSLMRISYAVFCLKNKNHNHHVSCIHIIT